MAGLAGKRRGTGVGAALAVADAAAVDLDLDASERARIIQSCGESTDIIGYIRLDYGNTQPWQNTRTRSI